MTPLQELLKLENERLRNENEELKRQLEGLRLDTRTIIAGMREHIAELEAELECPYS